MESDYINTTFTTPDMEDEENNICMKAIIVYDTNVPNRDVKKSKDCCKNKHLRRILSSSCVTAPWIFLFIITGVLLLCFTTIFDLKDNQKLLTKAHESLVKSVETIKKVIQAHISKVENGITLCSTHNGCKTIKNAGYEIKDGNERCFKVETEGKTWQEAFDSCNLIGGYLAEITDLETLGYVKRVVAPGHGYLWLGASNRNKVWVWAHSGKNLTVSDWGDGQPEDIGNKEDCLITNSYGGICGMAQLVLVNVDTCVKATEPRVMAGFEI